jgi:hypothetical protein
MRTSVAGVVLNPTDAGVAGARITLRAKQRHFGNRELTGRSGSTESEQGTMRSRAGMTVSSPQHRESA